MKIDKIVEVLLAYENGATIETRFLSHTEWNVPSSNRIEWNFEQYEYRVKEKPPEPRTIWVNSYGDVIGVYVHGTEELARAAVNLNEVSRRQICFVEVVEDSNARLMVTAPELLKVCKHLCNLTPIEPGTALYATVEYALTVIDKCEGSYNSEDYNSNTPGKC